MAGRILAQALPRMPTFHDTDAAYVLPNEYVTLHVNVEFLGHLMYTC